jgi:hypothetical protein
MARLKRGNGVFAGQNKRITRATKGSPKHREAITREGYYRARGVAPPERPPTD